MQGWSARVLTGALVVFFASVWSASAQITTGVVTGTVTDAQGGTVPGATVVLTSQSQGTKLAPEVTNTDGVYVIANVPADTYTLSVTLSGFKEADRKDLMVVGGARVSVPTIALQPGTVSETVNVGADIPILQAASGERSDVIQGEQLSALPVQRTAGTGFQQFANLLPGVLPGGASGSQEGRIGGGGQDNIMIDGVSIMDTGNNGIMSGLDLPVDAMSEVRVETSGYQAEFGRSSGMQVSGVTKSGTNQFHGSIYDIENNSKWNQNTWANIQNGIAKSRSHSRFYGFTFGGPVGKPGGDNKLFFFYAQEQRPSTTGGTTILARVPTMAERAGDFSQSLNASGQPLGALQNCPGCVNNVIPASELYGPGIAYLNQFPAPNVPFGSQSNALANYKGTTPIINQLAYLPTIRGDYQITPGLRVSAKWSGDRGNVPTAPGNFPGFTDTIQAFPWSYTSTGTVDYSLTPTTFIEANYGINQNRLGTPSTSPYSNRNNVTCAAENAGTLPLGVTGAGAAIANIPDCTLAGLPYPLSSAITFNPAYYETQANLQIGVPFLQNENGTVTSLLPPAFSLSATSGTGNSTTNSYYPTGAGLTQITGIGYPGYMNIDRNQDFNASVTKVLTSHTIKGGIYWDHSYKAQNFGVSGGGPNIGFQGTLSFANDTNNLSDTGFPLANAALGIFDTYGQANKFVEGSFLYTSVEGYLQDNWKVNHKLTLDYGLRFVHQGPQYDQFEQSSNFIPSQYNLNQAPALYQPACLTTAPCSGANRVAYNPVTGQTLSQGSSGLIGQAVPNSGSFTQGVVQAGTGVVPKTAYTWPGLVLGPRFGGAYDVTGNQKIVVRGSVGLFYDRPDGNTVFSTVTNPYPNGGTLGTTDYFGNLAQLGVGAGAGAVSNMSIYQLNANVPSDTQWNLGMQAALPWASSIDIAWVGHHAFNVLGGQQNGNGVDLNAVDLGAGLQPSGIDPTTGQPLTNNLLRSFQGYGNIVEQEDDFWRTFNSIQSTFTRRYRNNFSFGATWTYTIKDVGTTGMPSGDPQVRLVHTVNADGSVSIATAPTNAAAQALFADQGPTKNIATFNAVWGLPTIKDATSGTMKVVAAILNDWQLSGVLRLDSGAPYDIGYNYASGGGTLLTGSPDYTARILINDLSALGSGCSSNWWDQINNNYVANSTVLGASTAVMGPSVGSNGLESGRNLFHHCGNRTLDLSLSRSIRLGGGRSVQLRVDAFNAPNAVIFNSTVGTTINVKSPTNQTVTNGIYNADGTVSSTSLKPNAANNFGMATAAAAPRTIQGQIRFIF